jgi:hypothetical protein
MFSADADQFFLSPRTQPTPPSDFGVLYLLRRDIDLCMGVNPNTGQPISCQAEWPATMGILAGVDLLAKFSDGSDTLRKVGERFRKFLGRFFAMNPIDQKVIYQLRNSLLHSFGLYSESNGKVYRFFLTGHGTGVLVSHKPPDQYYVDLRVLHRDFENAVAAYGAALDADPHLQTNFTAMFGKYGRIHIG